MIMATKVDLSVNNNVKETRKSVPVDLAKIYAMNFENAEPNIRATGYSNLAYIQVSERDVYIDFLEMPGMKKDNKVQIDGVRIYMSFAAAQKLSETLGGILEKVYYAGGMEEYKNANNKPKKQNIKK